AAAGAAAGVAAVAVAAGQAEHGRVNGREAAAAALVGAGVPLAPGDAETDLEPAVGGRPLLGRHGQGQRQAEHDHEFLHRTLFTSFPWPEPRLTASARMVGYVTIAHARTAGQPKWRGGAKGSGRSLFSSARRESPEKRTRLLQAVPPARPAIAERAAGR